MGYDQWKTAFNKVPFYLRSKELKDLTESYLISRQQA